MPTEDSESFLPTLLESVGINLGFQWKNESRQTSRNATILAANERSHPPLVEHYLETFSQLDSPEVLLPLLQQEFWVRARFDREPAFAEYRERFPELQIKGAFLTETDIALTVASREEIERAQDGDHAKENLASATLASTNC